MRKLRLVDVTNKIDFNGESNQSIVLTIVSLFQGDVEIQLLKANNLYTDLSDQLNETNIIINVLNKLCQV